MLIEGRAWRTIWPAPGGAVEIIDQTRLPHELVILRLATLAEAATAIHAMQVRGAPLIGAAAAYGVTLAMAEDASGQHLDRAIEVLSGTRPTAINLRWALRLSAQKTAACTNRLHGSYGVGTIRCHATSRFVSHFSRAR